MAERSSGLVTALIVMVVMTFGALSFMFAMMLQADEAEQAIAGLEKQRKALEARKAELEKTLAEKTALLTKKSAERAETREKREEIKRLSEQALQEAQAEGGKIEPSVRELANTIRDGFQRIKSVDEAMRQDMSSFESTRKTKEEELRQANERLVAAIAQFEEKEKNLETEIAQIRAKLDEVKLRLKKVQTEALRQKTISDAGGSILQVGDPVTSFAVIDLGLADRVRKGLKFQVWSLKRGYGMGWVQAKGRNFIEEGVLPGDWLVVGRGAEAQRYAIVSVGISREAEEKGLGLARLAGADTLKIIGPGVTESFSIAGVDWKIERVTEAKNPEELGVEVKGMVEVTEVRAHTSDVVILPERRRNPTCPQCGWEAPEPDMKYCPFCFLGDSNNEVQQLDQSVKAVLSQAQNPFLPIVPGDRLSNPYFSPNRPLIFVLGSQPVRRNRQEMKAFIMDNGGRVVDPETLLIRPEETLVKDVVLEVSPSEINYLIPGTGPDADRLLKRARELGIRVMREEELFEFFGEPK